MDVLLLDMGDAPRAGHERMVKLACAWMDAGLARPLVACPVACELADLAREHGLPLVGLRGTSLFNPLVRFALARAGRGCDVALSQGRAVVWGDWLARRTKLAHVAAHWENAVPRAQRAWVRASTVVCPTAEMAGQLQGLLPGQRVRVAELALDPASCAPRRDRHDGRFVFLCLGELVEARGHDVLVEAMGLLQDMDGLPPWEVRMVGAGPCFQALLDKARHLTVDCRLALLGAQDRHLMLPMADALVAPDVQSDATALTVKEAWATGLPVVASSVPAHAELLRNKDNALLTPAGNPVTLAAAMMRCMQDAELRRQLVEHGSDSLVHYTWAGMADRMADICAEALSPAASATSAPDPDAPGVSDAPDAPGVSDPPRA